jgi:hypothetical protein
MQEKLQSSQSTVQNRFSFFTAITTTVLTIVTFVIAFLTPPLSGPLCTALCFEYPYTNITSRFPRDYLWMYPAILLTLSYVVSMVCIHNSALKEKRLFSQIGVLFSIMGALTLVIDYFVQVSVVQAAY